MDQENSVEAAHLFKRTESKRMGFAADVEEVKKWIAQVTGDCIYDFFEDLADGTVLCRLMLKLSPGSIPDHWSRNPDHFLLVQDNLNFFLDAAAQFGVPPQDLFILRDMGSLRNELQLLQCLFALGRQVQAKGLPFPVLGPTYYKSEDEQKRLAERKREEAKELALKQEKQERRYLARRNELELENKVKKKVAEQEALESINQRQDARTNEDLIPHGSVINYADLKQLVNSGIKYGYDLELQDNAEAKRNEQLEMDILDWIEEVTGEVVDHVWLYLKSGRKLCKLVNKIQPNTIRRINPKKIAMMERENITQFLDACRSFGVREEDLFEVNSLYNATNLPSVIKTIYCLAFKTSGWAGVPKFKNSATFKKSAEMELEKHTLADQQPEKLSEAGSSQTPSNPQTEAPPSVPLSSSQPPEKLVEEEADKARIAREQAIRLVSEKRLEQEKLAAQKADQEKFDKQKAVDVAHEELQRVEAEKAEREQLEVDRRLATEIAQQELEGAEEATQREKLEKEELERQKLGGDMTQKLLRFCTLSVLTVFLVSMVFG